MDYIDFMTRTSLDHHNCSFARTVDIIGDRWTLMILRDAFYGVRRFSQFKERLGITQAVLSARLAHLVDYDMLTKEPIEEGATREDYRLTEKGMSLFPVIIGLMQWGDAWIHEKTGAPILVCDKENGTPVDPLKVSVKDESREPRSLAFRLGPGANAATKDAFARLK
ncbi:winged helix-turn-helix transcriptional regulator [Sphingorhabdus sp. Alg231-15]|uniref:winged helix-turn-helix transcriptional regulator n=1 Tax=Sphingorhabdus sp. Alg231-15 TaxID=1922222 RepID=UPI000D54DA6F